MVICGSCAFILPENLRSISTTVLFRIPIYGKILTSVVHWLSLSISQRFWFALMIVWMIKDLWLRCCIYGERVRNISLIEIAKWVGDLGGQDHRILANTCVAGQANWAPELALRLMRTRLLPPTGVCRSGRRSYNEFFWLVKDELVLAILKWLWRLLSNILTMMEYRLLNFT